MLSMMSRCRDLLDYWSGEGVRWMMTGEFTWLPSSSLSAWLRFVLSSVRALLLNLRFPEQAAWGVWIHAPDVQQMGFTNITLGCTGFHSSSLCLSHSFLWVWLSIIYYFLFCEKKFSFYFLSSFLHIPLLRISVDFPFFERFARAGVRTESERGFQCWMRWSLRPSLTARQAPVFHLKRLWIYAENCSHLSSVNHLGAGLLRLATSPGRWMTRRGNRMETSQAWRFSSIF